MVLAGLHHLILFQPDPNNPQANATASPGAAIGSIGKNITKLKTAISHVKMPFKQNPSQTPPKPPSKDFLATNHQPVGPGASSSEDNIHRPYEDETVSRGSGGAVNNHNAVSKSLRMCCVRAGVKSHSRSHFFGRSQILFYRYSKNR